MIAKDSFENVHRALSSARGYASVASVVLSSADDPLMLTSPNDWPMPVTFSVHEEVRTKRNAGLEAARKLGDWILHLDSDETYLPNGALPNLDAATVDGFTLTAHGGAITHRMPKLLRSSAPWRYDGWVHEVLVGSFLEFWPGLEYESIPRTRTKDEYREHARILREELDASPNSPRTAFYLAQSYRDAGMLPEALATYVARANMLNGFVEENFHAWLEAGKIAWTLRFPWEAVSSMFEHAMTWAPSRAEPMRELTRLYVAVPTRCRCRRVTHSSSTLVRTDRGRHDPE